MRTAQHLDAWVEEAPDLRPDLLPREKGLNTVTLIDGREVDSASPEWREECLQRYRHVCTLMRLPTRQERADYLDAVRRAEGDEAARRLKAAFLEAWEQRGQRARIDAAVNTGDSA